jgi:hypothetical protein
MRPEEIDYSDTRKHYFDISNGEVLAGQDERQRYLEAGAEAAHIVDLGALLRDPTPHIDPCTADYEKIDTSDWSRERFGAFTRWLGRIVPEPSNPREEKVTRAVLWHARQVGLGPGVHAIREEFGTYTNLYREARVGGTRVYGLFDDWDVSDAVAYVKKAGRDGRPKVADLKRLNRRNPSNPKAEYLTERFRKIGGFSKLVELAGYPVIQNWDHDDYIDWGVRVMRANDGQVPSQSAIDYLSKQDKGPSASIVAKHFDSLSSFQMKVIAGFYDRQQEIESRDLSLLEAIGTGIREGAIPLELFSLSEHDPEADQEQRSLVAEELKKLYGDKGVSAIVEELGATETLTRYAKFKVVKEVAPWLGSDTAIAISRGLTDRKSFIAAVNKAASVSPGDVEHAALTEGVFDYIWPEDDAQLDALKLDAGYRKELDRQKMNTRKLRERKKVAAGV